ncbi:group II truncated hemoglobin [Sphingomonas oligophenolica]|uniref:Group II truncated hemoglobin n=1 Tax=Sphingomonas oligophenolica TaxID=301154 RepID=A0ABU9Y8B2_9SPHN
MTTGQQTPYDLLGGAPVIGAIVNRFYDLMDEDPAYAALRAMHAADLAPMRVSLAGFLAAWAGGPRDWHEEHRGTCIMSLHGRMRIDPEAGRQWSQAMARAIAEQPGIAPQLGQAMTAALDRVAQAMSRNPATQASSAG